MQILCTACDQAFVPSLDAPDLACPECQAPIELRETTITIACPHCDTEIIHDRTSRVLACTPRGAMLECGNCGETTQWRFTWSPFHVQRTDVTWGQKL